jgi:MFS transporter, UMF1 family
MPVKKRVIFAWSIYDLANTAFSALFVTFFFPLLIKVYLGGNESQIGLVFGLSMFIAGILVPIIGALSDASGRRMPFVIIITIICVITTSIIGFVSLVPALILGSIAVITYHAAIDVYNSILANISTKKNEGRISGFGIAVGYFGTILSLIMAYFILNYYGWQSIDGIKAMFPAIAIFFLGFSLVTFFMVRDKKKKKVGVKLAFSKAFHELKTTVTGFKKYKTMGMFLLASFIYNDGMNT